MLTSGVGCEPVWEVGGAGPHLPQEALLAVEVFDEHVLGHAFGEGRVGGVGHVDAGVCGRGEK